MSHKLTAEYGENGCNVGIQNGDTETPYAIINIEQLSARGYRSTPHCDFAYIAMQDSVPLIYIVELKNQKTFAEDDIHKIKNKFVNTTREILTSVLDSLQISGPTKIFWILAIPVDILEDKGAIIRHNSLRLKPPKELANEFWIAPASRERTISMPHTIKERWFG